MEPTTYWISGKADLAPTLTAMGITWAKFTGTQYQGCIVPEGKVIELWDLWNEGKCMFGDDAEDAKRGAFMLAMDAREAGVIPKRKPARRVK